MREIIDPLPSLSPPPLSSESVTWCVYHSYFGLSGPWLDPRLMYLACLVFIRLIFLFHLDSECDAINALGIPSLEPFGCRRMGFQFEGKPTRSCLQYEVWFVVPYLFSFVVPSRPV